MNNKFRKILVISLMVLILFVSVLAVVSSYPNVGYQSCIDEIAEKLKINPTTDALMKYVDNNIHIGMTRTEVKTTLEKISKVTTSEYYAPPGKTTDQVVLHICNSPLSNLVYLADYSSKGTLQNFEFLPLDE